MINLTTVMYHYVRNIKESRYPDIKGLELKDFIEQIEYMMKHYNFVTIEQIISSYEGGEPLPEKAILLTFDDAYAEHFNFVYPILKKYNIQGCFYPPASVITDNVLLDVNKIHFILASAKNHDDLVKEIERLLIKYKSEFKLNDFDYYYNKLAIADRFDTAQVIFIKRLLQHELDEKLRNKIADELFKKYVEIGEKAFCQELYMNEQQIEHLIRDGMHVGSHGYNHNWWNKLTFSDLEKEIDLSMDFLQHVGADMENWTACYPYGGYNKKVVDLLSKMNCKLAFTTEVDIADITVMNRLMIPRLDTNDIPKQSGATPNKWFSKA